jgi:hypothetical protein
MLEEQVRREEQWRRVLLFVGLRIRGRLKRDCMYDKEIQATY